MLETIDAKDNIISEMDCLATCTTLTNLDISFNQFQTVAPLLHGISQNHTLKYLKFNDNPFLTNRYNAIEPFFARLFLNLKEVNNLYQNSFRVQSLISVSSINPKIVLRMYENYPELSTNKQIYTQIINSLLLHQSEKSFIFKRIHSKIVIDYTCKTKYALYKNENMPFEGLKLLQIMPKPHGLKWESVQVTDMGMKQAKKRYF